MTTLAHQMLARIHDGLSYSQVGKEFRVTRCAVAGRVKRLREREGIPIMHPQKSIHHREAKVQAAIMARALSPNFASRAALELAKFDPVVARALQTRYALAA